MAAAEAARDDDDNNKVPHPLPLPYQTWVLKVSIHCEGCKKKVKKILKGIEGVYTMLIDSQQHKVTVTGNVDAETIVKKLLKSGKQAELWPEKKDNKKSAAGNSKPYDQHQPTNNNHNNTADKIEKSSSAAGVIKPPESGQNETTGSGNNNNNGGKKKKKKKKNQNKAPENVGGNNIVEPVAAAGSTTGSPVDLIPSMNLGRPPHQEYYYYPPLEAAAAPLYGAISYNTAYPSARTSSYYAPSLHAYDSNLDDDHYPAAGRYLLVPPPSDPIRMFTDDHHGYDDEGTGCSIM